jgi:hypothetical protein
MKSDVAKIGGSEKRIANGVDQNVGIGMTDSTFVGGNFYPPQPEVAAGFELMNVVP